MERYTDCMQYNQHERGTGKQKTLGGIKMEIRIFEDNGIGIGNILIEGVPNTTVIRVEEYGDLPTKHDDGGVFQMAVIEIPKTRYEK